MEMANNESIKNLEKFLRSYIINCKKNEALHEKSIIYMKNLKFDSFDHQQRIALSKSKKIINNQNYSTIS
jgi:hypothetical protein